ncbi:myotubularin-related protein 4 isoform X1 [Lutzomyia longipalpis]|uniref:myotubularin-related protein 4 isoform X1 n=1 Tax=Lutzomyia longipalpis TaxID=7200 RepID=UPI00248458B1|nr:myotubularin-related protein 4 isoform X1 [Lutzomyia longipalpis]XP_055676616.1 myotubularin-related protein 4 isoform X1 [Lutzomyia longipalpis]XP_055676617.1 myotubularin-related protein 4 isoform X1 [Lutzomyia longipalpis]
MEGSDGSPPHSMWMVRVGELYPKPTLEKEEEKLTIPFTELAGEGVKYIGRTSDGVLALSNYRIFLLKSSSSTFQETSVPLGLIESAQVRELFHLVINCKDASTVKCSFDTAEQCSEWQRRISLSVGVPDNLESLFAFPFYAWASELPCSTDNEWTGRLQKAGNCDDDFRKEVDRLQFDLQGAWRISSVNADFKLCPSYPRYFLVPFCISDETLQSVANFRSSRRIPVAVWRHKTSGAIISRCSQPEVGWLGWRNSKDEQLLKAFVDACAFDRGEQQRKNGVNAPPGSVSSESAPSSPEGSHEEVRMDEPKKILIVDARSYTSAVTNRARGGGCECIEYYPSAEIQFMNLGNIHAIRKSFHALRQLCASPPDMNNWLGNLERTAWLQHMSGLLAASMTVCRTIEISGRPVLVHCSDGWDRTPQIVATAQLCLDPYYRTVDGFRTLVEREWLSFGHKFADRCGHGPNSEDLNERCPVFLQWLDCVHQIHRQFPCSFEFSMGYLIKLAQHSHSCLFGTFLCNTVKERLDTSVFEHTFSVWPFLSGPIYKNPLYIPNRDKVLWPAHNVRDLAVWSEVYLGSLGNQNCADLPPCTSEDDADAKNDESMSPMTKTRSYGDLIEAGGTQGGMTRRSSDPNMPVESHMINSIDFSAENSIDSTSERSISPTLITQHLSSIIHDTTQKLESMTQELNLSDEELELRRQQREIIALEKSHENLNEPCDPLMPVMTATDAHEIDELVERDKNGYESNNFCDQAHEAAPFVDETNTIATTTTTTTTQDNVDGSHVNDFNSIMLQSVDLRDTSIENCSSVQVDNQNPWHGSVETSTDTLVPVVEHQPLPHRQFIINGAVSHASVGEMDATTNGSLIRGTGNHIFTSEVTIAPQMGRTKNLPEVHNRQKLVMPQQPSHPISGGDIDESIHIHPEYQRLDLTNVRLDSTNYGNPIYNNSTNRRRRNSSNSKSDISPKYTNGNMSPSATTSRFSTPGARSLPMTPSGVIERPNVAISCPDGLAHALSEQNLRLQQIVYEHKLREEALQRELYITRLALLKQTCQHCNNTQVVSEEQNTLKDLVMNEDINVVTLFNSSPEQLFRRFSVSPYSSEGIISNCDSVNSIVDAVENASVCSWEAVEERSGASSASMPSQSASSVLWVPDHAVSKCTGCDIGFWLGRRKHHCRSCGQIFCAECSEFWAPLPDERLYSPVRLCGPCYQAVTTKIQLQHHQQQQQNRIPNSLCSSAQQQQQGTLFNLSIVNHNYQPPVSGCSKVKNGGVEPAAIVSSSKLGAVNSQVTVVSSAIGTVVGGCAPPSPASLEDCKHAANGSANCERDRPLKAPTATN